MDWIDKSPNGVTTTQEDLRKILDVNISNISFLENIPKEEAEMMLLGKINEDYGTAYEKISEITGNCLRRVLTGTKKYIRDEVKK